MIIRIFTIREPAKPLNDAQMCGSFLFLWVYGNKNSHYESALSRCSCFLRAKEHSWAMRLRTKETDAPENELSMWK